MSSTVDRPTGSRAPQSAAPLPRLRWPSEQGRKSRPEKSIERSASVPPAESERAPLDAEAAIDSRVLERAGRPRLLERPSQQEPFHQEPSPQEPSPRAPTPELMSQRARDPVRQASRPPRDPFMLESLRQLGLAVAIVLVLGFVALRVFSPREANVVADAPHANASAAQKRAWTSPPAPKLEVAFDPAAPAGQAAPLRFSVTDAPEGSTIVVSGLGPGATLSQGENRGVEWRLGLGELSNLAVIPQKDFVGSMDLVVELRLPDGALGGRQLIKLAWRGDAAADSQSPAAQASAAPVETPLVATVTPPAASDAESVAEKQLARAAAPPQEAAPAQAEAPAGEAAAPPAEASETRVAPCFAKLDGKVVMHGQCRIAWTDRKSVTFESGEKRISITQLHDRVWRLKWNGKDKGKIFKRDDCWGSEKAWVCEHAV